MTWLYENPWPAIVGGAIGEVILIGMLYATGRLRLVVWMVVVAAIAGGLVWFERYTVTDREQIEMNLHEIAAALERGDAKTVVDHISPSAQQTIGRARFAASLHATEVRINSDLKIEVIDDVDPPQAKATGTVTVVGSRGYSGAVPVQVELTLRKVDGKWLIYSHQEPRVGLR
ncbi:MAG: hypothetical protein WD875_08015 [Pirellulales bacterium]